MTISQKIYQECITKGLTQQDAYLIGNQIEKIYHKNEDFLDCDFEKQLISCSSLSSQFDRLTELSYVDFLRENNFNLFSTKPTLKSKSCLDININNNWLGEFNCLHCSSITSTEDLKARLTQGLDKKFVKAYMELKKGNIQPNKPIILFYCYSDLIDKGGLQIIVDDIRKDKIPLEVECLCGYNFQKQNGVEIEPRYFIDKTKWIHTNEKAIINDKNGLYKTRIQTNKNGNIILDEHGNPKIEVLVDTTYISAVVFSPFIINKVLDGVLSNIDKWQNDLILIHNPSAKNSIKKNPFPTLFEYYITKKRINDGYKLKVKEVHKIKDSH